MAPRSGRFCGPEGQQQGHGGIRHVRSHLPKVVRQAPEVLVAGQVLAIRRAEEGVGIEEEAQLSPGPDEDLLRHLKNQVENVSKQPS